MRRIFASLTAVTLSCGTVLMAVPSANAAEIDLGSLTVLATTDVHGHALNYDYYTGKSYSETDPSKALGMEHLSTAFTQVRAEKGADSVLTLDNGDAIQGTSLESYYEENRAAGTVDPMASVFNAMGYDASVVGNHEYNYGLDALAQYQSNLNNTLLGANVIDVKTGKPALDPYTIIDKKVNGKTVKVGVIGVVTPGIETWDKAYVEGKLKFEDAVATANKYAPQVRAEGADVVIVLAHSGLDAEGATYDESAKAENVARSVAEQSTDIDVVIGGHSHVTDKVQEYFTNKNGKKVLFTQPGYWARFASQIDIPLTLDEETGDIDVEWSDDAQPAATALKASDYAADPKIQQVIEPYHTQTQAWVKTVVAQSAELMSAATSPWEDTPILDFVNRVQIDEVTRALKGTEYENLPIVAQASPFSRSAQFQKGDVTIADMAGLYTFDNTLYAVELTGDRLKDYLEWAARYYKQQDAGAEITDWSTVTNALYDGATRGIPDYSYDALSGVNYHINISKPVGERIENLTLPDGTPITADTKVVLALNNYRWAGGSAYPHVTTAPVVYNDQKEIRQLLIDWATEQKVIDPASFFVKNWDVSTSSVEVAPTPAPSETAQPSPSASTEPTAEASESTEASAEASSQPSASASALASESGAAAVVDDENGSSQIVSDSHTSLAHTGTNALVITGVAALFLLAGAVVLGARRRS